MISEWEQRFGKRYETEADERPRFSEEETQKIFSELHRADPRVALMVELGPDQRAGQVIRATRRDLDLSPGAGGLGYGQINLLRHSRGKKTTTVIDLHAAARAAVDRAIGPGGYLNELETALQAGEMADYHLWPGGRMSQAGMRRRTYLQGGRRNPGPSHATGNALIDLFRKYQEEIGVDVIPGRMFYGLRRVMADLAGDVETDPRTLRDTTGWKSEEMRLHYQRKRNAKTTMRSAQAREKIRALLNAGDEPGRGDEGPDLLAGLSESELEALLRRLQQRPGAAA